LSSRPVTTHRFAYLGFSFAFRSRALNLPLSPRLTCAFATASFRRAQFPLSPQTSVGLPLIPFGGVRSFSRQHSLATVSLCLRFVRPSCLLAPPISPAPLPPQNVPPRPASIASLARHSRPFLAFYLVAILFSYFFLSLAVYQRGPACLSPLVFPGPQITGSNDLAPPTFPCPPFQLCILRRPPGSCRDFTILAPFRRSVSPFLSVATPCAGRPQARSLRLLVAPFPLLATFRPPLHPRALSGHP